MGPVDPRAAAGIVLLRRGGRHGDRELEVLMLRRTDSAKFMPGVWVFPGGAVEPGDGEGEAGNRACAVRELAEEAAIELPAEEELVLFSRWITPEPIPIRYDARFYLALAPAHTPPKVDGGEIVDAAWWHPGAAVEAAAAGDLALAFPTITQLTWLAEFATSEAAITHYREAEIGPVLPRIVGEGERRRPLLPGEPGYDEA